MREVDDQGSVVVAVNMELFRPIEADDFLADYSKAEKLFGWRPRTKFKELVKIMVENDMRGKKAEFYFGTWITSSCNILFLRFSSEPLIVSNWNSPWRVTAAFHLGSRSAKI